MWLARLEAKDSKLLVAFDDKFSGRADDGQLCMLKNLSMKYDSVFLYDVQHPDYKNTVKMAETWGQLQRNWDIQVNGFFVCTINLLT